MNYRHGYHAGNFADVLKHAVLARILAHLRLKAKPFRVIDTHAGRGAYDLGSEEARRTGEWRDGIGRLAIGGPGLDGLGLDGLGLDGLGVERIGSGKPGPGDSTDPLAAFLAPYLEAVSSWRAEHGAFAYPGSPAIARHFLRRDDRLVAVEAQERVFAKLERLFPAGGRAKALRLDGYTAWNAFVPPKERRGLVVVDPPFEAPDEFAKVSASLEAAVKKWPSGAVLIWYPVKDRDLVARFTERLKRLALPDAWRVEFDCDAIGEGVAGLAACGLILVNPPWTLPEELKAALPRLAALLARGPRPRASCGRLA